MEGHPPKTRLVAGCMTGTSIDSIDAALVEITGRGLDLSACFLRGASAPLADLAPGLRRLADQEPTATGDIAALSRDFSLAHVPVLRELLRQAKPDLIAVHGQTVFHQPPLSWQMLTPAVIARKIGVPVVFDLRAADLAAGGQGAPITPLADWVFHGRGLASLAIVNLGGFCNITLLPPGHAPLSEIQGLDVCPCNHLLDTISRQLFNAPYDAGGQRALQGRPHASALDDLLGALRRLQGPRRSLGTGHEATAWIARWSVASRPEDLAATACKAIATLIAERLGSAASVRLAGGGAWNAALVGAIRAATSAQLLPVAAETATYREAMSMAVLGALCQDRTPVTLPQVTGVPDPAPIAGAWVYP